MDSLLVVKITPGSAAFLPIRRLLFALLLLLAGCATTPPAPPTVLLEDHDQADESLPLIASAAYRDNADLYFKYQLGERTFYGGGNWRDHLSLYGEPVTESSDYSVPVLVPLQYRQSHPWQTLPDKSVRIPVLPVSQWRQVRTRLFQEIVPRDKTGIVVDFDYAEYFLYYDQQGEFQATRIQDKPSDYSIRGMLGFDEFLHRGKPVLEQFLREHHVDSAELVFNTGDTGLYSLPFLYVNTESKKLVFMQHKPLVPSAINDLSALRGGQAIGHLLRSHLTNLLIRPISSLHRLFFVITDTAVSTVSFDWATGIDNQPVPGLSDSPPMDLEAWEAHLDEIAYRSATTGNMEFLIDGDEFFPRYIDQVSQAKESVKLQTYIFDNDDYALGIGELLKRRASEGVEVKVLLDGFGTIAGTMAESDSLPLNYQPPTSVRGFLEQDSSVQVRQKDNPWFTGDHVKSTIVDQQVAYIGGMNIGREYRYDWHDLMMELRGPVVDRIAREFDVAWAHAGPLGDLGYLIETGKPIKHANTQPGKPMRLLVTGSGNYQIYNAQLQAARRAQSYIYVQNAYFTDDTLLRELILARRRGVDVRVIIPMETDNGPITRSNILAINLMLEHGIRVYIYPGFSHVKAAIYDGWICAGSANFDRLSFRLNRELNIASSDPEIAEAMKTRLFEQDFQNSPELTEPVPARWVDYLVETIGDFLY
jgi:cardiolipin synthase